MGSLRTLRREAVKDPMPYYLINDFEHNLKRFMDKVQAQYPTAEIRTVSYDEGRVRELFVIEKNDHRDDLVANYIINAESWEIVACDADANATDINLRDAIGG